MINLKTVQLLYIAVCKAIAEDGYGLRNTRVPEYIYGLYDPQLKGKAHMT